MATSPIDKRSSQKRSTPKRNRLVDRYMRSELNRSVRSNSYVVQYRNTLNTRNFKSSEYIVCILGWSAEGRYPYDIMAKFFTPTYWEGVQRTDRYEIRWDPLLPVCQCQIGLGQLTVPQMRERARTKDSSTHDRFAPSRRRNLVSLSLKDVEQRLISLHVRVHWWHITPDSHQRRALRPLCLSTARRGDCIQQM